MGKYGIHQILIRNNSAEVNGIAQAYSRCEGRKSQNQARCTCTRAVRHIEYFDISLGKDPPFKPGVQVDLIMRTVNMEVVISKAQRICFQVETDVL